MDFKALGNRSTVPSRDLETFPAPEHVTHVSLHSDEVTSVCPVTGQPDFSAVTIEYEPDTLCIESKSLKLYLWSFRNEAAFCEAMAAQIAKSIFQAAQPIRCTVTVEQKPRGGIGIHAVAEFARE